MKCLALALLLLPSCAFYDAAVKTVETAERVMAKVELTAEEADANGDGKVSLTEMLIYLLGTLGVGGVPLLIRNAKSNERKAMAEARIEALDEKLAMLSRAPGLLDPVKN